MYITILVKQVYRYISQVSGERLQDHLSSGYTRELTSHRLQFGQCVGQMSLFIHRPHIPETTIHVTFSLIKKVGWLVG